MVVRADRDPKWTDAYALVQNTIRRLDWNCETYPWVQAAAYMLGMGVGLTARDMAALGSRHNNYVAVLRNAGVEIVGVKMAPEPRRGPRRKRYYRADLVPPAGEHV
jgi:hypothetical protein